MLATPTKHDSIDHTMNHRRLLIRMPPFVVVRKARLWRWEEPIADPGGVDRAASGPTTRAPITPRGGLADGWFVVDQATGTFAGVGYDGQDELEEALAALTGGDLGGIRFLVLGSDQIVLPGLIDAHIHVGYMGEAQEYAPLARCATIDALQQALREHAGRHPTKSWLVGVGWDQSGWGRYPTRHDLDAAVPDRPVVLYRACWHVVVCNTAALEKAGVSLAPRDKEKKEEKAEGEEEPGVDLDGNGVPTGVLRETAVTRVVAHMAETDERLRFGYHRAALRRCLAAGLTAVQTNDSKAWPIYQRMATEGGLPLRVFLTVNHEEMEAEGTTPVGPHDAAARGMTCLLSRPRIKLYSDGSLGAETAALRRPYNGTDNRGVLIHTPEELTAKVASAHAAGFQLEVHAIGDRALATVLDALEAAKVPPAARPVVTHCQVMGPDLMDRMAAAGGVANVQPSFVGTDCKWVQARIPPEVQASSYCWKTLLRKGIPCAGGSDAPVEDCQPLLGLYDAMHRLPHALKQQGAAEAKTVADVDSQVFLPDERLSFAEALWLYTVGAAHACFSEAQLGRIAPGFAADFVVLDQDVTCGASSGGRHPLLAAKVEQVWVAGACRLRRGDGDKEKGEEGTKLDGPSIPGKNGNLHHYSHLLQGKRLGASCCGP